MAFALTVLHESKKCQMGSIEKMNNLDTLTATVYPSSVNFQMKSCCEGLVAISSGG